MLLNPDPTDNVTGSVRNTAHCQRLLVRRRRQSVCVVNFYVVIVSTQSRCFRTALFFLSTVDSGFLLGKFVLIFRVCGVQRLCGHDVGIVNFANRDTRKYFKEICKTVHQRPGEVYLTIIEDRKSRNTVPLRFYFSV